MELVSLNISEVNQDIRTIFNFIYTGQLPPEIQPYLTDGYLFCLYKDP